MKFGSMFGITAPMVLVERLSIEQIKNISDLLNNRADNVSLSHFKNEINLVRDVYTNRFRLSPIDSSGILKREYRQYKRAEKFWLEEERKKKSSQFYEEPTTEELNGIWSKEKYEDYKKNKLPTLDMEINVFRDIYGENKGILSSTSKDPVIHGAYVILNYLNKKLGALNAIDNRIIVNEFTEIRVFNYSLYGFINYQSYYMQYTVLKNINNQTGNSKQKELRKLKQALDTLEGYVSENTNIKEGNLILPHLQRISREREINFPFYAMGKSKSAKPQQIAALRQGFYDFFPKYINSKVVPLIFSKRILNYITFETLDFLEELYDYCKSFNLENYNSIFGLNLNREQYIQVFKILEDHGIIGLNLEADKLFLDSLEKLHLTGEQQQYTISKDTFAYKNVECLKKYHETLTPFGEVI